MSAFHLNDPNDKEGSCDVIRVNGYLVESATPTAVHAQPSPSQRRLVMISHYQPSLYPQPSGDNDQPTPGNTDWSRTSASVDPSPSLPVPVHQPSPSQYQPPPSAPPPSNDNNNRPRASSAFAAAANSIRKSTSSVAQAAKSRLVPASVAVGHHLNPASAYKTGTLYRFTGKWFRGDEKPVTCTLSSEMFSIYKPSGKLVALFDLRNQSKVSIQWAAAADGFWFLTVSEPDTHECCGDRAQLKGPEGEVKEWAELLSRVKSAAGTWKATDAMAGRVAEIATGTFAASFGWSAGGQVGSDAGRRISKGFGLRG